MTIDKAVAILTIGVTLAIGMYLTGYQDGSLDCRMEGRP